MGSYLMMTCFLTTTISSGMFITAMAANPLAVNLATETLGYTISWGTWALTALVPGLVCLLLTPALMYALYPPEVKDTPDAPMKVNKGGSCARGLEQAVCAPDAPVGRGGPPAAASLDNPSAAECVTSMLTVLAFPLHLPFIPPSSALHPPFVRPPQHAALTGTLESLGTGGTEEAGPPEPG